MHTIELLEYMYIVHIGRRWYLFTIDMRLDTYGYEHEYWKYKINVPYFHVFYAMEF